MAASDVSTTATGQLPSRPVRYLHFHAVRVWELPSVCRKTLKYATVCVIFNTRRNLFGNSCPLLNNSPLPRGHISSPVSQAVTNEKLFFQPEKWCKGSKSYLFCAWRKRRKKSRVFVRWMMCVPLYKAARSYQGDVNPIHAVSLPLLLTSADEIALKLTDSCKHFPSH